MDRLLITFVRIKGEKILKGKKNLILITCDALRADFLDCYGCNRQTSPHIDQFAKNAVVFEQAFVTGPNTFSSFPTLLTGNHPKSYGEISYGHLLDQNVPISEILHSRRYKTGAFHSNPYLTKIFGYDRGFDIFSDELAKKNTASSSVSNVIGEKLLGLLHNDTVFAPIIRGLNQSIGLLKRFEFFIHKMKSYGVKGHLGYARAEKITQKAKSFITSHEEERFFLWIHYMDPHTPLLPPQKYRRTGDGLKITKEESLRLYQKQVSDRYDLSDEEVRKLKLLYAAEIRYLDEEIGRLIKFLRYKELLKKSTITITADHGEEFKEHGDLLHKEKLYNELLHVPLIIYDPELEGKRIQESVSLVDLVPTLLNLLGVPKPPEIQGRSLLPLIQGKKSWSNSKIISEVIHTDSMQLPSSSMKIALQEDSWKIIHNMKKKDELYHLKEDPHEKYNLIDEEKERARFMLEHIQKHLSDRRQVGKQPITKREIRERITKIKKTNLNFD